MHNLNIGVFPKRVPCDLLELLIEFLEHVSLEKGTLVILEGLCDLRNLFCAKIGRKKGTLVIYAF